MAWGSYGKMTSLQDLPADKVLLAHLRKAMTLNEAGVKAPSNRKVGAKPPPETPDDLVAALKKNEPAQATFDAFPPGCKREYIEWIVEAKREETRAKRLAQTIEWLAEGKRPTGSTRTAEPAQRGCAKPKRTHRPKWSLGHTPGAPSRSSTILASIGSSRPRGR